MARTPKPMNISPAQKSSWLLIFNCTINSLLLIDAHRGVVARALGYSLAARLLAATFERLPAGNFSVVLVLQCGRLDELYMRPVQRGNVSNGGRLLQKSVF